MNFRQLPRELQYKVAELPADEEFQIRFSTDEIMVQLEELKYDPVIEYNQVQLAFHNKIRIRRQQYVQPEDSKKTFFQKILSFFHKKRKPSEYVEFEPITLGLWSFLYTLKSPVVFSNEQLTSVDVDLFYYLLQEKDFNSPPEELFIKSLNYCGSVLHISQQQAVDIIQKLLKVSFRVLNMFPRLKLEEKPVFNLDWLTSIVTKVKQVSSYSTQELYKEVSVCEMYYLFAQFCRQKGSEAIYLRTEEDIMVEQDLRGSQLVVERLIEKGYIDETNKTYYVNMIHDITGG